MTQSTTGTADTHPLPPPKERRRLREAKSLSEEQVAAAVGVTRATVRAWETGRTRPRGRKREAYARLIGTGDAPSTPPAEGIKPDTPDKWSKDSAERAARPTASEPAEASEASEPSEPSWAVSAAGSSGGGSGSGAGTGPSPAEAFDALYRHTAAALFRQTYLLTGRRGLAREAVGKAFDLAWQRWPEVAADRDPVGWVRAAAYEHAVSPWHRLRRAHRHLDPPPEAPGPRALLDALLALPPSYRRTLLLHDGVGLGLPETAAETEASTPAAAGRLMTARAAVAEKLPELAKPSAPAEQSALLHERLGALALAQPAPSLPVPELIRSGSERKAQLWTRAAIGFIVLLIGLTLITLATAPRKYETPQSPAQKVSGVPPLGGPEKLTPQDKKLRKKFGKELVRGPARLVPEVG
ncbi:DNA-directed RNA polymerase specialized sigma24 family protein [Streptomyces sp. CEV 2-1]|uniref:helix-turn-helix domain-containing protein n=1 Tax=Streptomyces sp. CEV 2-1 TaxID=2485153 RepID=UPI000F47D0B5|nr:helix-turn-helix domain-containing protein [Streptomyces sp. CEV 2-1]ROQ82240.1 DNA-directed RNA polymerase specialized sigma24 family protein [Streptomyces sp. CEV 2-1]